MSTRIVLHPLHDGQREVWNASAGSRYHAVRCGRRWGKTDMISILSTSCVLQKFPIPGSAHTGGGRVGIFTAEYRQWQEIFDKLAATLEPVIVSKSRTEKRIIVSNNGKIDFWSVDDNELAGRGREYNLVLIDEAAFTKSPQMLTQIWPKAIRPTLVTTRGSAWVFSTPNGIDDDNFFYALCNDPKHGFREYHAPSGGNPYVPAEELEFERQHNDPRVFQQEFLAEFIDWSDEALFDTDKWLEDGLPVPLPDTCDCIFAVMDTALKGGTENDGTGVVYYAYEQTYRRRAGLPPRLTIVDWDVTQIKGSLLPEYIPGVLANLNRLSALCRPRLGSRGVFVEDAAMGSILLQKSGTEDWGLVAIQSELTAKGKDERGVMASGHHYCESIKIAEPAYNKTVTFKQNTANHLLKQVAGFHLADKNAHKRADDLLDCYTYGVILACGNGAVL